MERGENVERGERASRDREQGIAESLGRPGAKVLLPASVDVRHRDAASGAAPPQHRGRIADAVYVQPCRLAKGQTVETLIYFAHPPVVIERASPPALRWAHEPESAPRSRVRGVFQHATETTHAAESVSEGTAVVAYRVLRPARREQRPPIARRMGYNRPRPGVQSCVAFFVPRVYVGESVVRAVLLYVESGDHLRPHALAVPHSRHELPSRRQTSHARNSCSRGLVRCGNVVPPTDCHV